jgi:hypothetical protein
VRVERSRSELELFIGAGFDHHGAFHTARLFTGLRYSQIQDELQERVHDSDETDDLQARPGP